MLRNLLVVFLLVNYALLSKTVDGFAAKKKGGKPKSNASTGGVHKGFGAAPPTLEEILSKFPSRVPPDANEQPCPCGITPGRVYGECCGPLHSGEQGCKTMTDVLRSRYTAFSWRNIGYVMDTTHETCRDYREDRIAWAKDLSKGGMFDSFDFVQLEPGPEEPGENENEGFMNFKVTLRAKEDTNSFLSGQETVISERSRFLRDPEDQTWSYASGDVRSEVAGLEDTQLNV